MLAWGPCSRPSPTGLVRSVLDLCSATAGWTQPAVSGMQALGIHVLQHDSCHGTGKILQGPLVVSTKTAA